MAEGVISMFPINSFGNGRCGIIRSISIPIVIIFLVIRHHWYSFEQLFVTVASEAVFWLVPRADACLIKKWSE